MRVVAMRVIDARSGGSLRPTASAVQSLSVCVAQKRHTGSLPRVCGQELTERQRVKMLGPPQVQQMEQPNAASPQQVLAAQQTLAQQMQANPAMAQAIQQMQANPAMMQPMANPLDAQQMLLAQAMAMQQMQANPQLMQAQMQGAHALMANPAVMQTAMRGAYDMAMTAQGYGTQQPCCCCISRVYPTIMNDSQKYMCPCCGIGEWKHYMIDCRCNGSLAPSLSNHCFFRCCLGFGDNRSHQGASNGDAAIEIQPA